MTGDDGQSGRGIGRALFEEQDVQIGPLVDQVHGLEGQAQGDGTFPGHCVFHRCGAAAGILQDIFIQLVEVGQSFLLAPCVGKAFQEKIAGGGLGGVRHFDQSAVLAG